ncbi:MAG TPA: hypothetical protein VHO25_04590 [Polyangiaceae bacterium]|nr:hypothetical protein [Polyangiaceae bacterium]
MRLPVKRLRVYPNPWGVNPRSLFNAKGEFAPADAKVDPGSVTVDVEARPRGICYLDINEGGGKGYVGAEICTDKTVVRQPKVALEAKRAVAIDLGNRYPRQTTVFKFLGISAEDPKLAEKLAASDPEDIPNTPYYREQLVDGALIAADAETARIAGPLIKFVEPKVLFPALEQAAIKAFNTSYEDPDAYQYFHAERAKAAKQGEADAKPAPAESTTPTLAPEGSGKPETSMSTKPNSTKGSK